MGASSRHALAGLVLDLRSVPPTGIVPTLLGSSSVEENWLEKSFYDLPWLAGITIQRYYP